jgi:hypothetical protein
MTGGDGSLGDRDTISSRGEPRREFGGVRRDPPLRTWQVGHILTNREINSFGTLIEG